LLPFLRYEDTTKNEIRQSWLMLTSNSHRNRGTVTAGTVTVVVEDRHIAPHCNRCTKRGRARSARKGERAKLEESKVLCVESIGVSLLDSVHRASLRRPIVIRF